MYSVGEEFEKAIEDDVEYLTCIGTVNIGSKEYIICENENGVKRVFHYDSLEDELEYLEEDESDEVLEVWEEDYYGAEKEYMYWNDESGEYDQVEKEVSSLEDLDLVEEEFEDDGFEFEDEDDDLDDFLNDFLDDSDDDF